MPIDTTEFVVESFTNHLGQVINPGDRVFYVGRSGQSIVTNEAIFEGSYYRNEWSYRDKEMKRNHSGVRVGNIPGKRWVYDTTPEGRYVPGSGRHIDIVRKAILPLKRVYKLAV